MTYEELVNLGKNRDNINISYMRVSTQDKQEFIRQSYALKDYKIDINFEEKISGTIKATTRPEFDKMLSVAMSGDTIYFESMSRMARSMQDLIITTNLLTSKGIKVVFIKENISVGGNGMDAMTSLIFNIMGAFAQFERDLIADRTKQALEAKKESGVVLGRPKKDTAERDEQVLYMYKVEKLTIMQIAERTGISKSTIGTIVKGGRL